MTKSSSIFLRFLRARVTFLMERDPACRSLRRRPPHLPRWKRDRYVVSRCLLCDTLLITFQVEVGSEMYATPLSLVEDTPLPVPPPSGFVEPPPYDVGPVRRSHRVQGHEPYFCVGITRGTRWIPPSDVPTWLRPASVRISPFSSIFP